MIITGMSLGYIVALVAYFMSGRIARRSPHFGSGTTILSWVGLIIPCIAWIVMFQGYTALDRAVAESATPEMVKNKSSYKTWAIVYVVALLLAGGASRVPQ
jgi:hypothetical protein